MPTDVNHAPTGRAAVTFCSWHPVTAMVRRGPVRGPSHPCKRCNQRHQCHDSVVSVQAAHPERRAIVLIIRRSWVRAPPAPPNLSCGDTQLSGLCYRAAGPLSGTDGRRMTTPACQCPISAFVATSWPLPWRWTPSPADGARTGRDVPVQPANWWLPRWLDRGAAARLPAPDRRATAVRPRGQPASTSVALTSAPRPGTNSACSNRPGVRHRLRGVGPLRAMT
jgi:hypothetical protein